MRDSNPNLTYSYADALWVYTGAVSGVEFMINGSPECANELEVQSALQLDGRIGGIGRFAQEWLKSYIVDSKKRSFKRNFLLNLLGCSMLRLPL